MKTLTLKLSAFFLLISLSMATFAAGNGNLKASLRLKKNEAVELSLEGNSSQSMGIMVFNNKGTLVSSKSIANSGSRIITHKILDFPEGIYTYQVIEGDEVVYSARVVKLDESSLECRNVPDCASASISKLNDKTVLVRLANSPEEKLRISVRDEDGNVLYRKVYKHTDFVKVTHDISKFPHGNYYFSVYSNKDLIAYRKISK